MILYIKVEKIQFFFRVKFLELPGCIILAKFLNLSDLQFLHLYNGNNNCTGIRLVKSKYFIYIYIGVYVYLYLSTYTHAHICIFI